MKACFERDWEFIGLCDSGLIFKRRDYVEYSIIGETVRYVREGNPDVYLSVKNGDLVIELNRRALTPAEIRQMNLQKILEASKLVAQFKPSACI